MTNASDYLVEQKLRAAALDKDNFPRMKSERWLPVGLGLEAADEITSLRAKLAAAEDEATRQFYRAVVAETKLATATKALELVIMSDCGEPKVCAEIAVEALRAIKEKP